MTGMTSIWHRAARAPWAITEDALQNILDIAARQNLAPEAVAAKIGRDLEHTYEVENRNGIAILPVTGPLFRYANIVTSISGATSYQLLARDFNAAVEDPDISAIVLNVDSPGGEANGAGEFAGMIRDAREVKPVVAYVGGQAASAAYWVASAASEIVVHETALLGSIGVRTVLTDRSKQDDQSGVKHYSIVSSQSPAKDVDPANAADRAGVQATIDALADIFIAGVAANRGITDADVRSRFGQGGVLLGRAAVDVGMADRLGSYEGLINELTLSTQEPYRMNQPTKTGSVSPVPTAAAAPQLPIPAPASAVTVQHDNTDTAARAAQQDILAAKAAGKADGIKAERARVTGILTCDAAEGRERQAIALACSSNIEPDTAAMILDTSPKAGAPNGFFAAMGGVPNPDLDADGDADADGESDEILVKRVLAA